jgi:quercetin dioxygenase-like cupin family protein
MIVALMPVHQLTYDNTSIFVYHADKGQGLPKHSHVFSHLTMVHAGSALITKEQKSLVMTKDTQPVNLTANEWHEIEALEDGTVFVNVFAEGKY